MNFMKIFNKFKNIYDFKSGDFVIIERKTNDVILSKRIVIIKDTEIINNNMGVIYEYASYILDYLGDDESDILNESEKLSFFENCRTIRNATVRLANKNEIHEFELALQKSSSIESIHILKKFFNINKFEADDCVLVRNKENRKWKLMMLPCDFELTRKLIIIDDYLIYTECVKQIYYPDLLNTENDVY